MTTVSAERLARIFAEDVLDRVVADFSRSSVGAGDLGQARTAQDLVGVSCGHQGHGRLVDHSPPAM
jgi:hypothetical protein